MSERPRTDVETLSPLKRALLAVEELQEENDRLLTRLDSPIAIVGIGCRFPGSIEGPRAFWEALHEGRSGVVEVPRQRWSEAAFHRDPDAPGRIATRRGGFLDGVDGFDPEFFEISPREVPHMDPHHRLLLEVAWEALEDAGHTRERLAGSRTGVFVGLISSEFSCLHFADPHRIDAFSGTGTSPSVASGRLAYVLDLHGPSVTVDTACSSSLVALHLACRSLRAGESDLALAGGASLMLSPLALMPFTKMHMLSPTGRCWTFDAAADGFVPGEGCGMLVLKRLADAQRDGDRIAAVVRGSAVNQDGRSSTLSAPNGPSQSDVVRRAFEDAGVEPSDLGLIETHGTGTPLGDSIEIGALRDVFGSAGSAGRCALGAIKTNFGHTGAAAGVAGVIKAALALEHGMVPPNLNFRRPNPELGLEHGPFVVPTEPMPWPSARRPRVAGVSAFGWAGCNAHVVLEEAPRAPAADSATESGRSPDDGPFLLPVSARSPIALRSLARRYADALAEPAVAAAPFCRAAKRRRTHHPYRVAACAEDRAGLTRALVAFAEEGAAPELVVAAEPAAAPRRLVFVFPPHGSQWPGMGRELWRREPTFRRVMEAFDAAYRPHLSWSLVDTLLVASPEEWLDRLDRVQPVLVAFQSALAATLRASGIEPDAVVGHSMGEIAAAHVAGILSLEDTACVVGERTRVLAEVVGEGAMGVVELDVAEARRRLEPWGGKLFVAAANGPRSTVISGDPAALEQLLDRLTAEDVFCGWGVADVASHSPRMSALAEALGQRLAALRPSSSDLLFVSTVSGEPVEGAQLDGAYWSRHLRETVLFSPAVRWLAEHGHDVFLEIGPHPILAADVEATLCASGRGGVSLATLRRDQPERLTLLRSCASLYAYGVALDWEWQDPGPVSAAELPIYTWARRPFPWNRPDSPATAGAAWTAETTHSWLDAPLEVAGGTRAYEVRLDRHLLPEAFDHRVAGATVVSASTLLELMLAAAGTHALEEVELARALVLAPDAPRRVQAVSADTGAGSRIGIYGRSREVAGGAWTLHATARAATFGSEAVDGGGVEGRPSLDPQLGDPSAVVDRVVTSAAEMYRALGAVGVELGPRLRCLEEIRTAGTAAWASLPAVEPGDGAAPSAAGLRRPVVIEAALQLLTWLVHCHREGLNVPVSIGRLALAGLDDSVALRLRARLREATIAGARLVGDVEVVDEGGRCALRIEAVAFGSIEAAAVRGSAAAWLHHMAWIARPLDDPARPRAAAGRWLLAGDGGALAASLLERLRASGVPCDAIADDDHLDDAVAAASSATPGLAGVVCFALAQPNSATDEPADLDDLARPGIRRVLALHRALGAAWEERRSRGRLWLVTRGTHAVDGASTLGGVAAAPLWGLGRGIAVESREIWGGLIDLDPAADAIESARLLVAELSGRAADREVAFRGGERRVPRLLAREATARAGPDRAARRALVLRPDATYLVTGGLGGVGVEVARWLVGRGARHLLLLSRTALPPRESWIGLDPASREGARSRAVRALEAGGASVHVRAVDVGDAALLAACLARWDREGRPPIRGVVHAAALVEDRLLSALDGEAVESVLRPKSRGAWLLHRLLGARELDFFVLFSSLASLLGGAGQAAYAAANASLDALAAYRASRGLPALAIDWGVWRDRGLALAEGGRRAVHHLVQMGLEPLEVAEGLELLELALADGAPLVATLKVDHQRWRERRGGFTAAPILSVVLDRAEPAEQSSVRALLAAEDDAARRRRLLVDHLREQVARALQVDPSRIDPRLPVGDLGVDSFAAIELRNRLEGTLELTLSATMFWNHPTLEALGAHLALLVAGEAAPPASRATEARTDESDDLRAVLEAAAALDAAEAERSEREPRPAAGAER